MKKHFVSSQQSQVTLESGGTFDDLTMPDWMKKLRNTQPSAASTEQTAALGVQLGPGVEVGPLGAGVDPALAAAHGFPMPGAPNPFGLPPGAAPGGLLGHPPGILLPPGAAGPAGANLLMQPPRFAPPFPPPSFDASQPPPMRMPFPPPGPTNVPNVEGQGEVDMEIEGEPPAPDDVQARLRNLAENRGPPPERGKSSFLYLLILTFTKKIRQITSSEIYTHEFIYALGKNGGINI